MANPSLLETAAHLIAHCFREIESALRDVLVPRGATPVGAKPRNVHRAEIEAILDEYDINRQSDCARVWLRLADNSDTLNLPRHVHRNALQRARTTAVAETTELWEQVLLFLDGALDRFEAKFVTHVIAAEQLGLVAPPGNVHVKQLRERIPHNDVSLSKFFAVAGTAWVPLLCDAGYFANPPPPEWSADGRSVTHRGWPASRYLARLASETLTPDAAANLAVAANVIPDSENIWVREDIVAMGMGTPIPDAITIGRRAGAWVTAGCSVRLPDRVAALGLRIMEAGAIQDGLGVLRPLLALEPSPRRSLYLAATYDDYSFQRVMAEVIPRALALGGRSVLSLLCDALHEAGGSAKNEDRDEMTDDDACSFRCAIEAHPQDRSNHDRPLSLLIDAVRDTAASLSSSAMGAESVMRELVARPGAIFVRLAIHAARTCPLVDRSWIQRFLLDDASLDKHEIWHERRLLEHEAFPSLPSAAKQTLFALLRRRAAECEDSLRPLWIRRQLALLEDWLPADLGEEFARATETSGKPEHPELLWYVTDSRTDVGPLPALQTFAPSEVAAFVRNWSRAEDKFAERERTERLLRELTNIVANGSGAYAAVADQFRGGHPRLVWAVLFGFTEAVKKHASFDWSAVLTLCDWVATRDQEVQWSTGEGEKTWRWAQKQVADLLTTGLSEDVIAPARQHLDPIVRLSRLLVQLPEGGPLSSGDDPYSQALNSLHGAAAEALIHTSLWDARIRVADGEPHRMGDIVRVLLTELLGMSGEEQHLVHAMVGRYLPDLLAADSEWVQASVGGIFPAGTLGRLTMGVYVQWCRPHPAMLSLLEDQYREAIQGLPSPGPSTRGSATALVHHLAPLYWWGHLHLRTGLIGEFFEQATPTQRAEFLKYVGFCILHDEHGIDPRVQERAQSLWDWRRDAFEKGAGASEELATFGWWFASGKFPDQWAMQELRYVLAVQPDVEFAHGVADRLAALVPEHAVEALECLALLLSGEDDGWRALDCRDGIETAVRHARDAADPAVRQQALELVNRLVAQGNPDFLGLAGPQ